MFSQNLQRNIAGLLISQKVITEINNVTDIDKHAFKLFVKPI